LQSGIGRDTAIVMPSFAEFCADFFKKYFDLHPTEAIHYGIEGYDHLLKDYKRTIRVLCRNRPKLTYRITPCLT